MCFYVKCLDICSVYLNQPATHVIDEDRKQQETYLLFFIKQERTIFFVCVCITGVTRRTEQ